MKYLALLKEGTQDNPVWGTIIFQWNGWKFKPDHSKPHLFNLDVEMYVVQSLVLNPKDLEGYILWPVEVIPEQPPF